MKFETGKKYFTSSVCDHNCIYSITVIGRTAKTLKASDESGNIKTLRISEYQGVEQVKPKGSYSFAPVIGANDTKVLKPDWDGTDSSARVINAAAKPNWPLGQPLPTAWAGPGSRAEQEDFLADQRIASCIRQEEAALHASGGSIIIELALVLAEVRDFWAGGDAPAELTAKMNAVLTKVGL